MTKCTWVGCEDDASVPQRDRGGKVWANLCVSHDAQVNKGIAESNVKMILSNWVKAQGGAKKAAARM